MSPFAGRSGSSTRRTLAATGTRSVQAASAHARPSPSLSGMTTTCAPAKNSAYSGRQFFAPWACAVAARPSPARGSASFSPSTRKTAPPPDEEARPARGEARGQPRQPVGHPADAVEVPPPAARLLGVRPLLAEAL